MPTQQTTTLPGMSHLSAQIPRPIQHIAAASQQPHAPLV
jgi:hypothetical protein